MKPIFGVMRKLSTQELNRLHPADYGAQLKRPVRIILDNVRSLHNIGSVFRTADAFSIECIYLCGISATPPNREIHKTALGATETVAWKYFDSVREAALEAINDEYRLVLIEQTDRSVALSDYRYDNSAIALVFGNEIDGVSDELLPLAEIALEIPQYGTKHSLNISVCAGIVMYSLLVNRQ